MENKQLFRIELNEEGKFVTALDSRVLYYMSPNKKKKLDFHAEVIGRIISKSMERLVEKTQKPKVKELKGIESNVTE